MAEGFRGRHFSRKHLLVARLSRMLDSLVYTQSHGPARGFRRKGGLGFLPAFLSAAAGPTAEIRFLEDLNLSGKVVYDVGAFHGLLTMFFSRKARRVVAYEANVHNYARVRENLGLNKIQNVTVRNVAAGAEPGLLKLVWDPLMPGAGSADSSISSQIRGSASCHEIEAPVVRLDDDMAEQGLPVPDFVKIDIEGFELPALKGLRQTLVRHGPALYLEMHGADREQKEANVAAIYDFLTAVGYCKILHVESGKELTRDTTAVGREGHLYCVR
jgi:FkbM family methyltransferase